MPKTILKQPAVGSLEKLLRHALISKRWFDKTVDAFTKRSNGTPGGFGVKSEKADHYLPSERAYEKAVQKGQNFDDSEGYRYIKDMLRTSVSYPDCKSIATAIQLLRYYFTVVEAKDHIRHAKSGGYVDINMIVVNPETRHLCELQLHFDTMLEAKHHGGHGAYKVERAATGGNGINSIQVQNNPWANGSLANDWVGNKQKGLAQRAIWKGQTVYGQARKTIMTDPSKGLMDIEIRGITETGKYNAKKWMADMDKPGEGHTAVALEKVKYSLVPTAKMRDLFMANHPQHKAKVLQGF